MHQTELHTALKEIWRHTPEARLADNPKPSTFILCEVSDKDAEHIVLSILVVDREIAQFEVMDPDQYMSCSSRVRTAVELAQILPIVAPAISGVAMHGPFDKGITEQAKGDKTRTAALLRRLTLKGAVIQLVKYGKEHYPD